MKTGALSAFSLDRAVGASVLVPKLPDLLVCMYLLIGKGQSAQKDHIGAKKWNTEKFYE